MNLGKIILQFQQMTMQVTAQESIPLLCGVSFSSLLLTVLTSKNFHWICKLLGKTGMLVSTFQPSLVLLCRSWLVSFTLKGGFSNNSRWISAGRCYSGSAKTLIFITSLITTSTLWVSVGLEQRRELAVGTNLD
jgi:hypothetical protein